MAQWQDFRLVIHLVGEQPIPVFLTALHFPENTRHLLIVTGKKEVNDCAVHVQKLLEGRRICSIIKSLGEASVANDFTQLWGKFRELFDKYAKEPELTCVDITGGTKPMSWVAIQVAASQKIHGFYLDTFSHRGWWIVEADSYEAVDLQPLMKLQDFVYLTGYKTTVPKEREIPEPSLLKFLYGRRQQLAKFTSELEKVEERKKLAGEQLAEADFRKALAELAEKDETWRDFIDGPFFLGLKKWKRQLKFLVGTWFEYYTYQCLREHSADKNITEIEMNVTADAVTTKQQEQEFDVTYTDGYMFVIVECKTRRLNQADIQKLENLRMRFGGALGRAAMVVSLPCAEAVTEVMKERLTNLRDVGTFCGAEGVKILAEKMLKIPAGKILGEGAPEEEKQ